MAILSVFCRKKGLSPLGVNPSNMEYMLQFLQRNIVYFYQKKLSSQERNLLKIVIHKDNGKEATRFLKKEAKMSYYIANVPSIMHYLLTRYLR